jgi:hypothetical protein
MSWELRSEDSTRRPSSFRGHGEVRCALEEDAGRFIETPLGHLEQQFASEQTSKKLQKELRLPNEQSLLRINECPMQILR